MTKKKVVQILCTIAVLILLIISLFPFYYMILQSLVPWDKVDKTLVPAGLSLRSYIHLFSTGGSANSWMWIRALLNSLIVSLPTAVIAVATGLFMGYAMTKLTGFKGKNIVMNTLLFQMFFPTIILLVPKFMISRPMANSYAGMIIPMSISTWAIFMYINYFRTLPDSVFEAAKIDGAGPMRIIWNIALPVTKSTTTIVFLTTFMGRWSELMWDMLISPDVKMQTLNVLITTQFKPMGNYPGPMYAASVVLTLPIIILFLCFSKYFKEGISFMLK